MQDKDYSFKANLSLKVAWQEVAWQHNTGRGYTHKQDLIAVFGIAYAYIKDKVELYWNDTGRFDEEAINELISEFRVHFAPTGRVEGVNYYDDLLLMLSEKYNSKIQQLQKKTEEENHKPVVRPYREENEWLKHRLHLAISHAFYTVCPRWMADFLADIKREPDRAEAVFHRYRDHHLKKLQEQSANKNLYDNFFRVFSDENDYQDMLQKLTNYVHARFLNNGEELIEAEGLIERIYANNFFINQLNEWKRKNLDSPATTQALNELQAPSHSTPKANDEQITLTHSQIAILHHYSGQPITRNNSNDIARKYGQTSGQRLETIYKELTSKLVRTGKGRNRVKDIKAVLPLLTGSAKVMAEKELISAISNNRK